MTYKGIRDAFILAIGDVAAFYLALWATLFIRYGSLPGQSEWDLHLIPFSLIFAGWLVVFYIAGLYERPVLALRVNATALLFKVHVINSVIALAFFYFAPFFNIAPRTNLVIYLFVSVLLLYTWRSLSYWLLRSREPTPALLIANGEEMKELREEINADVRRRISFVSSIDLGRVDSVGLQEDVVNTAYSEEVKIIVIDLRHASVEKILPHLYNLIFSNIRFIDMQRLYEEVFDRVPLSVLHYNWFLENISTSPKNSYELVKRFVDITVGGAVGLLSLLLYPFVACAIYWEDGGPLFSHQVRVGKNNRPIPLIKFRTMKEANDGGKWGAGNNNRVTRVGAFLRRTRVDELPQLWNVLLGDLSLIGPRPEFPDPVKQYEAKLPYYNIRHLIKPGLSGWAQLYGDHPHHGLDIDTTRNKLSYDLYYIKNRSLFLDIKIILKTIKHLLLSKGK